MLGRKETADPIDRLWVRANRIPGTEGGNVRDVLSFFEEGGGPANLGEMEARMRRAEIRTIVPRAVGGIRRFFCQ